MKTLSSSELEQLTGGSDSFAYDAGQFFGGMVGWFRANLATYVILGPGVGGAVAIVVATGEAGT